MESPDNFSWHLNCFSIMPKAGGPLPVLDPKGALLIGKKRWGEICMRNVYQAIILSVGLGAAGLAVGYGIFGNMGGEYLDLEMIFAFRRNALERALYSLAGIDQVRANILWCGVGGAFLGLLCRLGWAFKDSP
jgi:hypothetical protein